MKIVIYALLIISFTATKIGASQDDSDETQGIPTRSVAEMSAINVLARGFEDPAVEDDISETKKSPGQHLRLLQNTHCGTCSTSNRDACRNKNWYVSVVHDVSGKGVHCGCWYTQFDDGHEGDFCKAHEAEVANNFTDDVFYDCGVNMRCRAVSSWWTSYTGGFETCGTSWNARYCKWGANLKCSYRLLCD